MASRTSKFYKKNPAARKRRLKQQSRYQKTKKGNSIKKKGNKWVFTEGNMNKYESKEMAILKNNKSKLQTLQRKHYNKKFSFCLNI